MFDRSPFREFEFSSFISQLSTRELIIETAARELNGGVTEPDPGCEDLFVDVTRMTAQDVRSELFSTVENFINEESPSDVLEAARWLLLIDVLAQMITLNFVDEDPFVA